MPHWRLIPHPSRLHDLTLRTVDAEECPHIQRYDGSFGVVVLVDQVDAHFRSTGWAGVIGGAEVVVPRHFLRHVVTTGRSGF